jgi:hypothetical protein
VERQLSASSRIVAVRTIGRRLLTNVSGWGCRLEIEKRELNGANTLAQARQCGTG